MRAVPASASGTTFQHPACRLEASTILVVTDIGDDTLEAPAFGLARCMGVKHRAAVPRQHGITVAPDTKPIHLDDAAAVKGRRDWVAHGDDTHEHRPVGNALSEPPGVRRIAVGMVSADEGTGSRKSSWHQPKLVVEHRAIAMTIADAA